MQTNRKRFLNFFRFLTLHTRSCEFAQVPPTIPIYRVLGFNDNKRDDESKCISTDKSWCRSIYRHMVKLSVLDRILYDSQRQGRISFYMTTTGEEATLYGSAAALNPQDVVFAQYREVGVLLYRGFPLDDIMNQCLSNSMDKGKGRQMPVHYGSPDLNFHTISSPLATQIPQAVGAAYALKRSNQDRIAVCYFGEGAASEGDFHAALNMAATTKSPVLFFWYLITQILLIPSRNNGYAISTPTSEQYKGDGIAGRGAAYGIRAIRVDGSDVFAVYNATKMAREYVAKSKEPVIIEAISYRMGHHSTSDDSLQYRKPGEAEIWRKENPIEKLKTYLKNNDWWTEDEDKELASKARENVLNALKKAESYLKPKISELFTDVYSQPTQNLKNQQLQLERTIERYSQYFPLDDYEK